MSRSGRALLSVLALVGSTLAGTAGASAQPGYPDHPGLPVPEAPPPTVTVSSTVDSGPVPLTVTFDATTGLYKDFAVHTWDFTGDGVPDAEGPTATWTFTTPGQHLARVTVTDGYGEVSFGELPVIAGNTRPAVVIDAPADGVVSEPGEPLPFRVTVTDDGAVDCTKVVVTYDATAEVAAGPDCTGVLTPEAGRTGGTHTVGARYTDAGAPGVQELTGSAEVVLNPREHQAPFVVPHINLAGVHHLSVELAAQQPGGSLAVHADSPAGPVVATFPAVPEASPQWLAADVVDPGGVHDLYFVGNGVSATTARFQTVPAVTATIPPLDGWHTADVPVTVTTAPLWDPVVSLDGGVTWTPAHTPVVLSTDGVHDVQYRAVDAAGRSSAVAAAAVRIDKTAPTAAVPAGAQEHAATLDFPATDATSGVAALTVAIDGVPVAMPIELWRFPSGVHQLTVTTTDVAGNTATHTTELAITASLPGLRPLSERFAVPFVKSLIMRLQLMAAEHAHATGQLAEAATWVEAFRYSASLLRDPAARDTLTADALLVKGQLR
jgi:PKD repeat protein